MQSTFTKSTLALLVCLILKTLFLQAQDQHLVQKISLMDQVDLSTQIVEGKVISKESFWDDTKSHIYTKQIIEVYKVFKGQPTKTIEVITKGGIVGLQAEVVSHSLHLENGDIGLFTLQKQSSKNLSKISNSNAYKSVSDAQSFYKYSLDKNIAINPFDVIKNIDTDLYAKLENQTKSKFTEVKSLKVSTNFESNTLQRSETSNLNMAPSINSFSSIESTAGTKTILTINGNGFGNTIGKVGFSDANYGGYLYYDALTNQIISWSDTKIEVMVPDRAGTGKLKVTNASDISVVSDQKLMISYAQINLEYSNNDYQTQHIDDNGKGGYTWTMNTDFKNSGAKDAFMRAFESWTCSTGVNWEISSSTTSTSVSANDGINIITFSDNLGSGTLGQCYSRYEGCHQDGEIKWYVTEMDIIFNPNKNWNYSTSPPSSTQVDFETVTVHELGHGHQLGHVIDTNVVMHYSISTGESLRNLDDKDLSGAVDIQARSTSQTICSESVMTQSSCYAAASLSTDEFTFNNHINIYPNPAKEKISIRSDSGYDIKTLTIFNVLGKEVFKEIQNTSTNFISIDVSDYHKGIYMIQLDSSMGSAIKKVIVN